jgi:hypothetical protein
LSRGPVEIFGCFQTGPKRLSLTARGIISQEKEPVKGFWYERERMKAKLDFSMRSEPPGSLAITGKRARKQRCEAMGSYLLPDE